MSNWFKSLLVAVVFSLTAASVHAEEIVLAADPWCPYNCIPQSDHEGFQVEISREALAFFDIEVTYKTLPYRRALELAELGEIDGVLGALKDESETLIYPAQNIGFSQNVAVVRKGNSWTYQRPADLKSKHLLLIQGYSYGPDVDTLLEKDDTITTTYLHGEAALDKALRMLIASRADILLEDRNVVLEKARHRKLQDLVSIAGDITPPQPTYVAFSPRTDEKLDVVRKLEQGLQRLQISGRLKEIFQKYGFSEAHFLQKTGQAKSAPTS